MKKILTVIFVCLALNDEVLAYSLGPVEGGVCDSCDIWIDEINRNGGRVHVKWASSWEDMERDIVNFVGQNCASRGYQPSATMPKRYELEGRWFPTQAKNFTCDLPDPYLVSEYASSGVISSIQNNLTEIQQMADSNCQKKSLGFAKVISSGTKTSSRTFYGFECHQPKMEAPTTKQPNQADEANQTPKITMIEAKRKCEEIGFKPKTEKFGNCVLELTK